ncbi:hypothetical protein KBX71_27865 [Micromonospora sp. D93]|uniref:hypothetical protein n=1 Tax=Micromonospora sp. D93 TaxID=2824886 RepID=UPI001B39AF26|nr:hypothetical protein [Micromonospora sp. D93]MBQ1021673.1 hypothetical protein [Micromonospora sp. D93]
MASVVVTNDVIDIRFTGWERLWTGRDQLVLRLAAVRRVDLVNDPLRLARGARRGYVVSGFTKIGVWGLFGGPRQLVAVRRAESGVHLVLDRPAGGGEFDEVVLSSPTAPGIVATIKRSMAAHQ